MEIGAGGRVVRLDEQQSLQRALVLGVILTGVFCLPGFLVTPSVAAQERESPCAVTASTGGDG